MDKEELFLYIQGSWKTKDGGEPRMSITISGIRAIVDEIESVVSWNSMEDTWVIENGMSPIHLFPNENDTLTTLTFKNGPFPALGFLYNRII
jgi:hypothetical protein